MLIALLIFCIWAGMSIDFQLEKYMFTLEARMERMVYILYKLGNLVETVFILSGIAICAIYFIVYFTPLLT